MQSVSNLAMDTVIEGGSLASLVFPALKNAKTVGMYSFLKSNKPALYMFIVTVTTSMTPNAEHLS